VWIEFAFVLYFFKNLFGYSDPPTQVELEKVYISFAIAVNWVLLFVLHTSKVFSQWSEFLLNCLYICTYTYESLCRMDFPDSWGKRVEIKCLSWVKSLYICLSFGCSAVLFRLLHLLSLLVGWLDCLFGFWCKILEFSKNLRQWVSHSWIVSFSGLSWIVQHTHKLSLLGCYFDETHKSPLLIQHLAYYLQSR